MREGFGHQVYDFCLMTNYVRMRVSSPDSNSGFAFVLHTKKFLLISRTKKIAFV